MGNSDHGTTQTSSKQISVRVPWPVPMPGTVDARFPKQPQAEKHRREEWPLPRGEAREEMCAAVPRRARI